MFAVFAVSACSSGPDRLRSFEAHTASPASAAPSRNAVAVAAETTSTRGLIANSSAHQKVGRPYTVAGQTFVPQRNDRYDEIGIGSWYGPNFHGRPTANGEVFNQWDMTAAHTTLPIPSIVEVTNLENGRQIIVRLNDRGPFVDDRIIDLSRAAAEALDYHATGLARVRVRYLGPAHASDDAPDHTYQMVDASNLPPVAAPAQTGQATPISGPVTLQVGAFGERRNAERLASRLDQDGEAWVEAGRVNGRRIYRVFYGRWRDYQAAQAARSSLASHGVYDARIIGIN